MTNSKPLSCVRCRQPLPDGSMYCISCGCSNEGVLEGKIETINKQFEQRRTWEMLCRWFPFLRLFK